MKRTLVALLCCPTLCGCPQLMSDDFVIGGQAGAGAHATGGGGTGGGTGGGGGHVGPHCRHAWSKRFGAPQDQYARDVALDAAGNVLIIGNFEGRIDFGGGDLNSEGETDIFVAKFDPDGGHLWSRRFGDWRWQDGRSVAADAAGNVIITGDFYGNIDFGGGTLSSAGGDDIFVAKLDPSGGHLWSKRFGHDQTQRGRSVAVDGSGNVILTGDFEERVNFGGGALISAGGDDIYVAKFDPNGEPLWSSRFGNSADHQRGLSVAVGSLGNVLVTGELAGSADFGGGPLASVDQADVFLVSFADDGEHQWSERFGGTGDQAGNGVAVDREGGVRLTGEFAGTIDFGGDQLQAGWRQDVFLARLAAEGASMWALDFGDASDQRGRAVAVDSAGNSVITGAFEGTVDFGGGRLFAPGEEADAFVAKFKPGREHLCSLRFGDEHDQQGTGVAAASDGGFVITGYAAGTVDFGGGPLEPDSHDDLDVFVARFTP